MGDRQPDPAGFAEPNHQRSTGDEGRRDSGFADRAGRRPGDGRLDGAGHGERHRGGGSAADFRPVFHHQAGPDESGHGGTGLGLAACRTIIESHRGRIRVESTVGRGTAFTIKLPVAKAKPIAVDSSPTAAAALSAGR
ncbi:MAG: sensor histidine kinase [Planctomycetota bacterium]